MIGEILSLILPLNPDENRRKSETSAGFGRYFDIDTRKVAVVVKIEIRGIYIAANQQFFFFGVVFDSRIRTTGNQQAHCRDKQRHEPQLSCFHSEPFPSVISKQHYV